MFYRLSAEKSIKTCENGVTSLLLEKFRRFQEMEILNLQLSWAKRVGDSGEECH
jgi:hypothetical protein